MRSLDEELDAIISESTSDIVATITNVKEAYAPQQKTYRFNSSKLSQKAIIAHEELYKSYVEALGKVSLAVDSAKKDESNSSSSGYRSNKVDEVTLLNSVYLHELFFANCFDPNSQLFQDMHAYTLIARDFGTFDDWTKDIVACAMAARDGWAVCGWSVYLKKLVNFAIDGHDKGVIAGCIPLVVLDVHEHSYYLDYQNDRKKYVYGMLSEINWDVVEDRIKKIEEVRNIYK